MIVNGKDITKFKEKELTNYRKNDVGFVYQFFNLIKIYGSKIYLNDFRNLYQDFFWNCIMNFKLAGLSCDMLLKYNKSAKADNIYV